MEIKKSHWVAGDTRVSLAMPITKVDREKRLVSGYATLDNIDSGDDVVTADSSATAFTRFRGNIREMHEPIAAGRLVDFRPDTYYSPEDNKFYDGIYVTAYVSKGAQSTWEKVLDGTLSGFSIGGKINEADSQYVADIGKVVRYITDYDLIELSLVDNPANQYANVVSFEKDAASGEMFMKGMVSETYLVNIFWCSSDAVAKNSSQDSENCLACGSGMEIIGWFEKGEDEVAKTETIVSQFLRQEDGEDEVTKTNETGEGGVEMTDENKNEETEVTKSEEVETEAVTEEVETETVAKEAEVTEEVSPEPDFEKMFDNLRDSINDTVKKNQEEVEEAVRSVEAKVAEVTKAFDDKSSELEKSFNELSEKLDGVKTEREETQKRLDALESATAIKKSGDVESPAKRMQKSTWSGAFFNTQ